MAPPSQSTSAGASAGGPDGTSPGSAPGRQLSGGGAGGTGGTGGSGPKTQQQQRYHQHQHHQLHPLHEPHLNGSSPPPAPAGSSSASGIGTGAEPLSPTTDTGTFSRRPGKRPAARGTAFYPRKRANTACQVCRARKTKCDNKKPSCSYCLSVGATCIQSPVDLSSFDPASLKILDRLDELERLLRTSDSASGSGSAPVGHLDGDGLGLGLGLGQQHDDGSDQLPRFAPPLPHHPPALDHHARRRSSNSLHHHSHDVNGNDESPMITSILPERVDHVLQWPIFTGGQGGHIEQPYAPPPDALSPSAAGATSLSSLVDMESHRLYRLLDDFFLYVHCKNPILDESSARRLVGRAFLDGIDWSPASCLAMLVCALGSLATPFGPSEETKLGSQPYADSQVFFQAAQKRIGILLVRSDIVGAQCLFLSGVYMMTVFQPIYAWRYFSQALAACQHFPFLTRAQNLSSISAYTPESMDMGSQDTQEQAVYWSAWKSERELRQELSLPDFDIIHSGTTLYPPFFPAPPVPLPESPDGPDSETQRSRAAWLFYLAEISLRRLTSRLCSEVLTLRKRYPSHSAFLEVLADMTPEYEAQAREWSDSLPAELSIHTPIEEDGICRSVLRGRLINLFEMIYWPFVMANLSALATGRPVSPVLAELAERGLETHIHQVQANEPGFQHRHHGGLFMIRSCTRSALALVAAAKTGSVMPPNWDQSVYKVIGMLSYWEDEDCNLTRWKNTLERELTATIE